jgi:3-oxoacyl-[acyl-carrier-protein] synthase-3
MRAAITATARYLPSRILTNSDLEKMVDTSDEWIRTRTGINERRIVKEGEATIIIATVTPDMFFPSVASLVQKEINATKAWGFDLSGACTGFLYALENGSKFIESGAYRKVMVIGADTMSTITDYTDRNTCVLFGDGAGGILLEPAKKNEGIIDSILRVDGTGAPYLYMPGGGSQHPPSEDTVKKRMHYIRQDGKAVFKFAVKGMADISADILRKNGIAGENIKIFIPHQANKRIIDAAAKRCKIPEDRVLINIDRYGNTTAATIPIGLDEVNERGGLEKNDIILLAAFGAGFSWGSTLIRWGDV